MIDLRTSLLMATTALTLTMISSGCALNDTPDEGDLGDEHETTFGAIQSEIGTSCVANTEYLITSNVGSNNLCSTTDYICTLAKVTGELRGFGERVEVKPGTDGMWKLNISAAQPGVSGKAYCFKKSLFTGKGGNTRWVSDPIVSEWIALSGCPQTSNAAWWGDAVTFIQGITGKFMGGGESVSVIQSNNGFTSSQMLVHSCQDQIGGTAQSFFVGDPHAGNLAEFYGPYGVGPASVAGTYAVNISGTVNMAPTSQAICMFTYIAGGFNGGGEAAEIRRVINANGVEVWQLLTSAQSGDGVFAQARCYTYNQN